MGSTTTKKTTKNLKSCSAITCCFAQKLVVARRIHWELNGGEHNRRREGHERDEAGRRSMVSWSDQRALRSGCDRRPGRDHRNPILRRYRDRNGIRRLERAAAGSHTRYSG